MKKNIIALLLVLAVVSFGVFAAPANVGFDVTTSVEAVNAMKLTKLVFEGTTETALGNAAAMELDDGDLVITSTNLNTGNIGYISTISNSRAGYAVTMTASAMSSTVGSVTTEINYEITAGSASFDTSEDDTAVTVIDRLTTKPTELVWDSEALSIIVNSTEFAAAVEGDYEGTVTFTWTVS